MKIFLIYMKTENIYIVSKWYVLLFLLFGIDSNSQYEKVQTNLVIFNLNFIFCNA